MTFRSSMGPLAGAFAALLIVASAEPGRADVLRFEERPGGHRTGSIPIAVLVTAAHGGELEIASCSGESCGDSIQGAPLLELGASCQADGECGSGYCRNGHCCSSPCGDGYCHNNGVCVPLRSPGEICDFDPECGSGICDRFEGICCRDFCTDLEDCNSPWAPGVCVPFLVSCIADCNGDGGVSIDELVLGVSIAMGFRPLEECDTLDHDGDDRVAIDEMVVAVLQAMTKCRAAETQAP